MIISSQYLHLGRTVVAAVLLLTGLSGRPALAAGSSGPDQVPPEILWQEQMHQAWEAMNARNFGLAEETCREALRTAAQCDGPDGQMATNLVLLADIYQSENKSDLAAKAFQDAVASAEKAFGTNGADLVMPLEKLADFYYFAGHRYDLAAPLCERMLRIVEATAPQDATNIIKRARAVAAVYRIQGDFARAEPYYRQTLTAAGKSGGDLAVELLNTAGFYCEWGKYAQAESLCQQALVLRQQAAGANPGTETQMNLAIALYGLAEIYRDWGRLDRAEELYRQSLAIVEKSNGPDSSELARPLSGLAAALAADGQTNQAVALYQRAFAVTTTNLPPGDPVTEDVLHGYTTLLENLQRPDAARKLRNDYQWQVLIYECAHALRLNNLPEAAQQAAAAEQLAGTFGPGDTRLSRSEVQMAEVYRQQGKPDLAEQTYQEAITSCEIAVGPKSSEMVFPLQSLANYYYYTRIRYDQVAVLYQKILDIVRSGPSPDPLAVAQWCRNLADVRHLQHHDAQAENLYQQALAAAESATNAAPGETVQYLQALGDLYRLDQKFEPAERVLQRALGIREQAAGAGADAQLDVAVCCDYLGHNYQAWNKLNQAESCYRRSLAIVEKIGGPDSLDLPSRLISLAEVLRTEKRYGEAERQYQRALAITQKAAGPDSPQVADILDPYATLLADMQKITDAKDMRDWAAAIRKENQDRN